MYSFMDGCNGYNQVKMLEENKEKIDKPTSLEEHMFWNF
jgi:hypothetical protein